MNKGINKSQKEYLNKVLVIDKKIVISNLERALVLIQETEKKFSSYHVHDTKYHEQEDNYRACVNAFADAINAMEYALGIIKGDSE